MATPEAGFKTNLREAFEALYGKKSETSMTGAIGVALGQPSGLPDRFFGANGRFTWLEAKVKGCCEVKAIQEWQMKRLAACGQQVVLATLLNHKMGKPSWTVRVDRWVDRGSFIFPWSAHKSPPFWDYILRWSP